MPTQHAHSNQTLALEPADNAAPASAGQCDSHSATPAQSSLSGYTLARICVRILALLLLFQGITALPELALVWRDYTLDLYLSVWVLFFALVNVVPLVAGVVFWWQTELITGWLVGMSQMSAMRSRISLRHIFCVVLCAVGVMITLQSLPDLAGHMFSLLLRPTDTSAQLHDLFVTQVVVSAVETSIGLVIIFTAHGLARWAAQWWPTPATRRGYPYTRKG